MQQRGWFLHIAESVGRSAPERADGRLHINAWAKGNKHKGLAREALMSKAWCVRENTPIAPLVFMDWFKLKPSPDFVIDKIIQNTCLEEENRYAMQGAIGILLVEIGFPEITAQWKALAEHLAKLILVGENILELTSPKMDSGRRFVILPADIAVRASTESSTEAGPVQKELKKNLEAMIEYWESELEAIQPWVSKRGQKGDPALRHFAEKIVGMAGNNLALPSNEAKDGKRAAYDTPLLKLMRESLRVAIEYGDKVLERSSLDKVRKKKARAALASLKSKSDGALIDHLRAAKKDSSRR